MCVALAALAPIVRVSGPNGERTIAFEDFHRLPADQPELDNTLAEGELIVSLDLPEKGFAKHFAYLKLRDRHSYAFALVERGPWAWKWRGIPSKMPAWRWAAWPTSPGATNRLSSC